MTARRFPGWLRDLFLTIAVVAVFIAGLAVSIRHVAAPTPWCDLANATDSGLGSDSGSAEPPPAEAYQPLPRRMLLALPTQPFWLRITPDHPWNADDRPVLVVNNTGWTGVALYLDGRRVGAVSNRDDEGIARRDRLNALFLLPSRFDGPITLHVTAIATRNISLQLMENEAVHADQLAASRLITACAAILAVLAFLGGLFWVSLRHPAFLAYTVMAGSAAVYLLLISGEGFHWPLGMLLRRHHEVMVMVVGLGSLSSLALIQLLLGDTPPGRRLRQPIRLIILAWVVIIAFALFLPEPGQILLRQIGNAVLPITILLALGVMVPAAVDGSRPARLLLSGGLIGWFSIVTVLAEILSGTLPGVDVFFPIAQVLALTLPALALADVWAEDRRALTAARSAAETDVLTRALNRRAIATRLDISVAQTRMTGGALSVIFVDLDHFKGINDTHGHAAGDLCLRLAAQRMQSHLRPTDRLGRWGGEEFLILLPGTGLDDAVRVAERIRSALASAPLSLGPTPLSITASLGVAALGPGDDDGDSMVKRADDAVYQAKREGRDRVVVGAVAMPALESQSVPG